jgi:predicted GH43/DUF377 family glycosyl hydrolase
MARISTYDLDSKVTGGDKWIGTDSGSFNKTKNFTPIRLAEYFNSSEKIDSTNSLRFYYQIPEFEEERAVGTISFESFLGLSIPLSDLSYILLSKTTEGGIEVPDFLASLIDSKVLLHKGDSMNVYGIYEITSIEDYEINSNFFKISFSFIRGNGNLANGSSYLLSVIDFGLEQDITKHSELTLDDGTNPHGTTKSDVGLSNVDNTSDIDKPISTATQEALDGKLDKSTTPSSVYGTDASGDQTMIPVSEFKDVLEFANLAAFPATGESSKIYLALDTNLQYRWSGSAYVQIGGGTVAYEEKSRNLNFSYLQPLKKLIESGAVSSFDEKIRELGNYFIDEDGTHYISYTGYFGASGLNSRACLAKSVDGGLTFTKEGVMFDTPSEDPYIIKVGGTYFVYTEESTNNPKKIQVHTSTDLITWTFQNTCLDIDGLGNWDSESLGSPLPYYEDGTFYLFYEGLNLSQNQLGAIGIATSIDGINFTKDTKPLIIGTDYNFPITDQLTVEWAKYVVCDDLVFANGKYFMSFHGNNIETGFIAGILTSENLTTNYIDFLNTWMSKKDENVEDIMFVNKGSYYGAIYIASDSKSIYEGVFSVRNEYDLNKKSIKTDTTIEGKELTVNEQSFLNGDVGASGLKKYNTKLLAKQGGVKFDDLYVDSINEVVKMDEVYNLVTSSDPSSLFAPSTNLVAEPFAWGVEGLVNCFRNTGTTNFTVKLPTLAPLTPGEFYNLSFYVIMDDLSEPRVYASSTGLDVDFRLEIGTLLNVISNVELVSGNIYRITAYKVLTIDGIYISRTVNQSSKAFRMSGFQVTKGKFAQPYSFTPYVQPTLDKGFVYYNGKEKELVKIANIVDTVGGATLVAPSDISAYVKKIPAGTYSSSDFMNLGVLVEKIGVTTTCIIKLGLSTSATLPNPFLSSQIALYVLPANQLTARIKRTMTVSGGNIEGLANNISSLTDDVAFNVSRSVLAFDPTVDNYLHIQVNSSDTIKVKDVYIR